MLRPSLVPELRDKIISFGVTLSILLSPYLPTGCSWFSKQAVTVWVWLVVQRYHMPLKSTLSSNFCGQKIMISAKFIAKLLRCMVRMWCHTMIAKWCQMFEKGRTNMSNDPCIGHPSTVNTIDNADHMNETVHSNRHVKINETASEVNISYSNAYDYSRSAGLS